jgi:hypothetical protein
MKGELTTHEDVAQVKGKSTNFEEVDQVKGS